MTVRTWGDATLDKIYINMDKLYGQPHTRCPVGNADHNVVICEPLVDLKFISGHRQIVTTKVMGQNERVMFASDLKKIKWEDLYHVPSCEEQLQMFTSNINELTDIHFPTKTVVKHTTDMGVRQIPTLNSSASTCMEGRWPSVEPSLQKQGKSCKQVIETKIL